MSLRTTPTTTTSLVFGDDDEETWKLLVSPASSLDDDIDMSDRLKGLSQRFEGDLEVELEGDCWKKLCGSVKRNGFSIPEAPSGQLVALTDTSASSNQQQQQQQQQLILKEFPIAFDSDYGRKHIAAVTSLLQVSNRQAMQMTMSALRSVDSTGSQFQSLLGTRELLIKTMFHHFQQRFARLSVVTECLRMEQDPDCIHKDAIVEFLDGLDGKYQHSHKDHRGLLRRLLWIACKHATPPTREQLQPSTELRLRAPSTLQEALTSRTREQSWNQFTKECIEARRDLESRERLEAMEALLVLLYDRIKGGVKRLDYALILTSFHSANEFFTSCADGRRLCKLAGLICAECASLWRVFDADKDESSCWASQHPLLLGVDESTDYTIAEAELESLGKLMKNYATYALDRYAKQKVVEESPEGLALLAFGLLLRLSYDSFLSSSVGGDAQAYWQTFKGTGTDFTRLANDEYNAFDYLQAIMDYMTPASPQIHCSVDDEALFDWQFSSKQGLAMIEDGPSSESADISVLYTSIAREIVDASISAFGDILSIQHSAAVENIGLFCNLVAGIYRNNALLCERFWLDWESYTSPNSKELHPPMCTLMDKAYSVAVTALKGEEHTQHEDAVLRAITPLLTLLSSLCYTSNVVELAVKDLPLGLLRKGLLYCRMASSTATPAYLESRAKVLESISFLTRTGVSTSCREQFRIALEDPSTPSIEGPHILYQIISKSDNVGVAQSVMNIKGNLLDGAPLGWSLQYARVFNKSLDSSTGLLRLLKQRNPISDAASRVLLSLIENLTPIVFCEAIGQQDTVLFLEGLLSSMLAASYGLVSSLSIPMPIDGKAMPVYETAQTIMLAYARFLMSIRTVITLHINPEVRSAAQDVRHALIGALATSTGLGQAIAYYATAPVALSLVLKLQNLVDDASILQLMSNAGDDALAVAKKYGPWQTLSQGHDGISGTELSTRASQYLRDLISDTQSFDIDPHGIEARGWTFGCGHQAPLNTASAALKLLSQWASHVEEMHVGSDNNPEVLATFLAYSPQGLLASLATRPVPTRNDNHAAAAWSSAGLSNLELLLLYLAADDENCPVVPSTLRGAVLDLVFASMVHVQCFSVRKGMSDSRLFQALHRSDLFAPCIIGSVKAALSNSEDQQVNKEKTSEALLSLRILAACAKTNPEIVDKLFFTDETSIVSTLSEAVAEVLNVLEAAQGDYQERLLDDDNIISLFRVATGCLNVILLLWTRARTTQFGSSDSLRGGLCDIIDDQGPLLKNILTIVSRHAAAADLSGSLANTHKNGCCVILSFMSMALDILSTEMAWLFFVGQNASTSSLFEICRDIFGKEFMQLPSMSQYFATTASYRFIAQASDLVRVDAIHGQGPLTKLSGQLALLKSFPSTSVTSLVTDFYVQENAVDVGAAAKWVVKAEEQRGNEIEAYEMVDNLSASYHLFTADLNLLGAWRRFVEILPFFSNQSLSATDKAATSNASPSPAILLQLARKTLEVLHDTIQDVEFAQCEISHDFLQDETGKMAADLAGLLLFFVDLGVEMETERSQPSSLDSLLDTLSLLTTTSESLFTVLLSRLADAALSDSQIKSCCFIEQPMLASAIVLAGAIESRSYNISKTQRGLQYEIYDSLARITGQVLNGLVFIASVGSPWREDESADEAKARHQYKEALMTCTSLLTVLISRCAESSSNEGLDVYFAKIARTIRKHDVLGSLLEHANLASASAASLRAAVTRLTQDDAKKRARAAEDKETEVVKSIFTLINAFADVGDPQLLSLLASERLLQVVGTNPLFSQANHHWTLEQPNASSRRGYIHSNDQSYHQQKESIAGASTKSGFAGRDDPIHDVWLTTLRILKSSLRSSAQQKGSVLDCDMKLTFFNTCIEFLDAYHKPLVGCLRLCSAALKDSLLTINALREATNILALVSELCTRPNRDKFIQARPELYREFMNWSNLVVVSISKFLGASGTSRELFVALAEYDAADSMDLRNEEPSSPLNARNPLLLGGFANAKHEAIRYSHFASRCYARVTRKDFEASSIIPEYLRHLAEDRGQDSALERNCRRSVTSAFILELEQVAAECLSQAVSIIWQTHPAASCFVCYSQQAASQLDAMALVSCGMIIAFRPATQQQFTIQDSSGDSMAINFGKVLGSDTVNRTWLVRVVGRQIRREETEEQTLVVSAHQLAGIEDLTKRKCVAAYIPAPDSASELENTAWGSLTLGHLILVLRWCHQDSIVSGGNSNSNVASHSCLVQRIAEQVVALLGTELSIHDEILSHLNLPEIERARLDAQILELFGDDMDTVEGTYASQSDALARRMLRGQQQGRLKGILGEDSWRAIRPQISREAERACRDIEEKERKRREANSFEGSWYGSSRWG